MAESVREPDDDQVYSLLASKYDIPNIKSDLLGWDSGWEKLLQTLSAVEDVYPVMSKMWKKDPSELTEKQNDLKKHVCAIQEAMVDLWDQMEEMGHFVGAWLLLDGKERKRHLLKGLEDGCAHSSLRYDSRGLCPEITVRSLLKKRGAAFTNLINTFHKGKKEAGTGNLYFHPSEWWQQALDASDPNVGTVFTFLTVQRNEFMAHFLLHASLSVLHDLSYGSPGMDPVVNILKENGPFARAISKTIAETPDKPIIRCQNCTKSPEEIGEGVKFMLCSSCRSKLNFSVHYCSKVCQKEDWRNHKKHCGKEKVVKQLKGTAHDPLWAFPSLPDHFRSELQQHQTGDVPITSMGFGTAHPSRPHSPALQRQVSLINGDKEADYFLFDDLDRPIRFAIPEMWIKMAFRILRSDAMFGPDRSGLEAIAEYVIKNMSGKPGLSRERILAQFNREYGDDTAVKVARFERKGRLNGYEKGVTFVEVMGKNMLGLPDILQRAGR